MVDVLAALRTAGKFVIDGVKSIAAVWRRKKLAKNTYQAISEAKKLKLANKALTPESQKILKKMKKRAKGILTSSEIESAGGVGKAVLNMTESEFVRRAADQAKKAILKKAGKKVKRAAVDFILDKTGARKYSDLSKAIKKGDIKDMVKVWAKEFAPNKVKEVTNKILGIKNTVQRLSANGTEDKYIDKAKQQLGKNATKDEIANLAKTLADIDRTKTAQNLLVRVMKLPLDKETKSAIYTLNRIKNGAKATAKDIQIIVNILKYKWEEVFGRKREHAAPSEYNRMLSAERLSELNAKRREEKEKEKETGEEEDKEAVDVKQYLNLPTEEKKEKGKKEKGDKKKEEEDEFIVPETDTTAISWEAETGHHGRERSFAIDKYRFVKNSDDSWSVYYRYRKKRKSKGVVWFLPGDKEYSVSNIPKNIVKWIDSSSSKGRAFRSLIKGVIPADDTNKLSTEKLYAYFTEHPNAANNISEIQKRKEQYQKTLNFEKQKMSDLQKRFESGDIYQSDFNRSMNTIKNNMTAHKEKIAVADAIAEDYRRNKVLGGVGENQLYTISEE